MSIQLIVGLANPGKEYEDTRHNAGAWFVHRIAEAANVTLRSESKFHGKFATAHLDGHQFQLLIPTTFMNLSGQSVRACMNYLKISADQLLVAHDEIDLPNGSLKLKYDGGDGGHNGLKDIFRHLNTKQFYRLRIGVGHPGHRNQVVDYVLQAPSKAERQKIEDSLLDAEKILPFLLKGDMQKAMQALHTNNNQSSVSSK